MVYLLAFIGVVTLTVVGWRILGTARIHPRPAPPLAPDDDPDFLRDIATRAQPPNDNDDN